jgi:hypothetical protein
MIANVSAPRLTNSIVLASAAFAAVLLAIVVPLLMDFGYGKLDAEVWFWGLIACCFALVLGWIDSKSIRLGAILLAVLFYVVADLYFVHSDVLSLGVLACFLTVSLSSAHATFRIVSVVFSLIFIATSMVSVEGSLFQSSKGAERTVDRSAASQVDVKLPPIVHIILDEFASLSRMPDFPPLRTLDKELETDYLKRGFTIYPATRSTSGSSAIALSELVGPPGQRYQSEKALASKKKGSIFQVPVNDYFAKLRWRGYNISVIQSSHLDFCGDEAGHCLTYKRAEFIDASFRYSKTLSERLRTAGAVMHARASAKSGDRRVSLYSYAIQGLNNVGATGLAPRVAGDEKIWSPAGMSLRVFDYLDARFITPKPGNAYFVHLLLPHFPFVLDRDCNLNPPGKWRWPLWAQAPAGARSTLDEIYAAYGEQLRCTHARVIRLIDAMMKSQMGPQIIFMIHGDHGPRIHSKIDHLEKTNAAEAVLADGLDTFFAVKAPGLPPRIDKRQELLPVRFHEIIERQILTTRNR